MDLVISKARELGRVIQEDSRYKAYTNAAVANEQDKELQSLVEKFDEKRGGLNKELQMEEKDTEKIKELDAEVKSIYQQIFASPTMIAFNNAREELQSMLTFVNQIITGSSNGENPDTIQEADCGSSCSSCAGCS